MKPKTNDHTSAEEATETDTQQKIIIIFFISIARQTTYRRHQQMAGIVSFIVNIVVYITTL